jgi:arsenate reductase
VAGALESEVIVACGRSEPPPCFEHEDWQVADPKGQDLDTVRAIVSDIDSRVQALLATVKPA